jgi:cytochrome c biogenesis protein CcdA
MGQAIGQAIPFAVGVALSPVPIIAVVLMLASAKGPVSGPAFLAGWVLGLAVLGTIVLLAASGAGATNSGAPANWVSILKLVLGVLLLALAVKQWNGRPEEGIEPKLPAWMKTIDTFSPIRSASIAAVLSSINPKNLILVVGGAASIAQTGATSGQQAAALAVFIAIASLGVGTPVAIYFVMGDRAATVLGGLRDWMASENATIMAVLFLVFGAKLIGDAISTLSG